MKLHVIIIYIKTKTIAIEDVVDHVSHTSFDPWLPELMATGLE